MTTILTLPTTHGRCDFCHAPAVSRSQQVNASGAPLREPVLACRRHKTAGRLLAERTPALVVAQVLARVEE